jgi:anti-anti-sigma factor
MYICLKYQFIIVGETMNIQKNNADGKITFVIDGRLDTTTAPQLQEVLIPAFEEEKEIMLDFAGLAYVSSAGLRVLLLGEKTAKAKGGKMILINVSQEVRDVFEMTGFSDILNVN